MSPVVPSCDVSSTERYVIALPVRSTSRWYWVSAQPCGETSGGSAALPNGTWILPFETVTPLSRSQPVGVALKPLETDSSVLPVGAGSHASPTPSGVISVVSACVGFAVAGQLSQASPRVSASSSFCAVFATSGQLSRSSGTPSPSRSPGPASGAASTARLAKAASAVTAVWSQVPVAGEHTRPLGQAPSLPHGAPAGGVGP